MDKQCQGILAVLGGILALIVNGSFNVFGALSLYAVSYFKMQNMPTTIGALMLFLLVRAIISTLVFPFGASLKERFSIRG